MTNPKLICKVKEEISDVLKTQIIEDKIETKGY